MKQKKIIERNLPLTVKYQLISIRRQNIETAEIALACANCNAEIINFATIQAENGLKFDVGLDCMATLTKALVNLPDYEFELYAFNSALRDYALMKTAERVKISDNYIQVRYLNKKGIKQEKVLMRHVFENYGFDLSPFIREKTAKEKRIEAIIADIQAGKPYEYTDGMDSCRIVPKDGKNLYYNNGRLQRVLDFGVIERILERILTEASND